MFRFNIDVIHNDNYSIKDGEADGGSGGKQYTILYTVLYNYKLSAFCVKWYNIVLKSCRVKDIYYNPYSN